MTSYPFGIVLYNRKSIEKSQGNDTRIQGYMAVSDVGRMAIGSSRSELPLLQFF